jgi:serine/threonine protein kinase
MPPADHRRIRELFEEALALDPSGRTAFLRDACGGDQKLERQVGNLLKADAAAASFLEAGVLPASAGHTTIFGVEFSGKAVEFPGTERFRVIRKLGAGGFGIVYEVTDRHFHSVVALKTLPRVFPEAIGRLKREFRALAELTHPNLATLYELFQEPEYCFFTMELIDGVNFLQHAITTGPGPPFRDALVQLANGVNALHDAGKLHCDLKPHNVLVDRNGRTVILDFGLITDTGSVMPVVAGTPEYMAPEQALGLPLSPATDWYAVGAMLYHALTGHPPASGSVRSILTKKQNPIEPLPSDPGDNVPEDLSRLCIDLLSVNPAARPTGGRF